MMFTHYAALSRQEAMELLLDYLATERDEIGGFISEAQSRGLKADYSIETLDTVLIWVLGQMKTFPVAPDMSLPDWIRNTESYVTGLFEFTDESKILLHHAGYYMGACFLNEFPTLYWGLGDERTTYRNMPVIAGFNKGIELPPPWILNNLFRGIIQGTDDIKNVQSVLDAWKETPKNLHLRKKRL